MRALNKNLRYSLNLCLVTLFISSFIFPVWADSISPKVKEPFALGSDSTPEGSFAQGRFIVKFKSSLTASAQSLLESKKSFASALTDGSDSLDKLNKKVGAKRAKSLFMERANLSTQQAQLKQEELIKKMQRKFSNRAKRAPKTAKLPDLTNVYMMEVSETDIEAVVKLYSQDPHVEYAQLDYMVEPYLTPSDPYYNSSNSWGQGYDDLWGHKKIQMTGAWDQTQGASMIVAVVDSGVDTTHPDIATNIWRNTGEILNNGQDDDGNGYIDDINGWNFSANNNNPTDNNGHGTHVAGIIAAIGNNNLGIIGIAPQSKVMPVKGLSDTGAGEASNLAASIIYAAQNGADVINNSWGCAFGCPSNPVVEDAVRYAYNSGAVVVFAAGNFADNLQFYSPQNMIDSKPIVVGASTQSDARASFSNYGEPLDILAPGGGDLNPSIEESAKNILSLKSRTCTESVCPAQLIVGTQYLRQGGTSMAAPFVSGLTALIAAAHVEFNLDDIRNTLVISADDLAQLGFDPQTGFGRMNATRALSTQPSVLLRSINYATNDPQGNANGFMNPGESIALSVTIKNLWIPASNVVAFIESTDPNLVIQSSTAALGDFQNKQEKTASFRFYISPSTPDLHSVKLNLRLTASNGATRYQELEVGNVLVAKNQPPSQNGWPLTIQSEDNTTVETSIVDLNNDGRNEVVVLSGGYPAQLSVYNEQGQILPGWPKTLRTPNGSSGIGFGLHPIIGDIDQNGTLEIFVYGYGFYMDGTPIPGWPRWIPDCSAPADPIQITTIADLNKDGTNEIIGMHARGLIPQVPIPCYTGSKIYIWDGAGNLWPNMPINVPLLDGQSFFLTTPALGDLDDDGQLEIITSGYRYEFFSTWANIIQVFAFRLNGQSMPGWPITTLTTNDDFYEFDTPVIGDLNRDQKDDVMFYQSQAGATDIFAWNGNGVPISGWPRRLTQPTYNRTNQPLALGDVWGDESLEILLSQRIFHDDLTQSTLVHLFRADGEEVTGWPKELNLSYQYFGFNFSSMYRRVVQQGVMGDINGDAKADIVLASVRSFNGKEFTWVNAWDGYGNPIPNFPFYVPESFSNSPLITDLNKDGFTDLVLASFSHPDFEAHVTKINIWNLGKTFSPSALPWPMYGHDSEKTFRHQKSPSDGLAWSHCAWEGEVCSFSGTKEVRYGANGSYFYQTLTNGVSCTNGVFGDPIPGVRKSCEVRDVITNPTEWDHCAWEGEVCSFSGTKEVRYGANGSYFYQTLTNGVSCTNGVFGDPIPGVRKSCEVRDVITNPPDWSHCAWEGEVCSFSGTKEVRYGANGTYFYQTVSNGVACHNSVFGDPIPGVRKSCEVRDVITNPTEWDHCAWEGEVCSFSGTKEVRYGANGSYFYQTLTNGVWCTNGNFDGDPIVGVRKACSVPQTAAAEWTFCAGEGEVCAFSGTKEVRYGANSSYFYKTLSNGTACSNTVFGDPIPGLRKFCDYR